MKAALHGDERKHGRMKAAFVVDAVENLGGMERFDVEHREVCPARKTMVEAVGRRAAED